MTVSDVRGKLKCPDCDSERIDKTGFRYLADGSSVQRFQCRKCGFRFSENANNMSRTINNHQICVTETKNLENTTELRTVVGEKKLEVKGKLLQFAFYCQKEGMKPATIRTFNSALKRLGKIADLNSSESVKEALGKMQVTENTKVSYCVAYTVFLKFQGKSWCAPRYKYRQKLPLFLPTEEELNGLIAGCGPKTATILQF